MIPSLTATERRLQRVRPRSILAIGLETQPQAALDLRKMQLTATQLTHWPRPDSIPKSRVLSDARPRLSSRRKLKLQCETKVAPPKPEQDNLRRASSWIRQSRLSLARSLLSFDREAQQFYQLNRSNLGRTAQQGSSGLVTADSYTVLETDLVPLLRSNDSKCREVASLTKIFTCYCCLLLVLKHSIPLLAPVRVSERASSSKGTSAGLQPGDVLSVQDLLFGMMLPSGNDAAVALAQFFGLVIHKQMSLRNTQAGRLPPKRSFVKYFMQQVNRLAKELRLENTFLANPHGLMNHRAYSTSTDLAVFCAVALRNPLFRRIVSAREHSAQIINHRTGLRKDVLWTNTNKLLGLSGYCGIKTGVTSSAGPCFAGLFEEEGRSVVVVLLGTQSMGLRFRETQLLVRLVVGGEEEQAEGWGEDEGELLNGEAEDETDESK